ncbi:MAG: TonB-dependent receptor [Pseudomonadota bacterium]
MAISRSASAFDASSSIRFSLGTLLCFLALAWPAQAAADPDVQELADLSLEDLANTRVTSVSKRSEPIGDAAASVFVITGESIRRAGATTLPEAVRLAPNIQVARVDARNYAVTARGFNNAFENKLLVLIDGRSVYSPLFSGVFWDAQDVELEDVERIEVISGPGATLWGVNAVNGVINIITKAAGASQGVLAGVSGDREHSVGTLRHGGALGDGGRFRLYGKTVTHQNVLRQNGLTHPTGYRRAQAGFRADWGRPDEGLTVQGDAYSGALHQLGTADITIAGANLLGRKTLRLAGGSEVMAQAYWDFTERKQPNAFIEHLNTVDLQLQHALILAAGHRIVWGGGYRLAMDRLVNGPFSFLPAEKNLHWGNVFIQDEIDLSANLRLIAGAKFEHNNYTGMELLPTLRLAWKPGATSLAWGAASRTVRAPSRTDRDFYSPSNPQIINGVPRYAIAGGPGFDSEAANVLELGYRIQATPSVSFSATAFASDYARLRTLEPNPNGPGAVFLNKASGKARGLELWGAWQVVPAWRLSAGLVSQRIDTELAPDSRDASGAFGLATTDPDLHWKLRSSYDVASGHSIDLMLRYYGKLERPAVPAYRALDLNYIWQINRHLELSVTGTNLLDAAHVEYGPAPNRAAYRRNVGVKLVWRM